MPSIIQQVAEMMKAENTDAGLDLLYDHVESKMKNGQMEELNQMVLESLQDDCWSCDMAVSMLCVTLPVKTCLPDRPKLYARAQKEYPAPNLLRGLA